MKCPKCDRVELEEKSVKGRDTRVDRCPQCAGLWFDEHELAEVLGIPPKKVEIPGDVLALDNRCPRCEAPLHMFCYPGTMVIVDMCRACGGIWLDDKEIQQMKAVRSTVRDMTQEREHERERAREQDREQDRARAPDAARRTPQMMCPKCGHMQEAGEQCAACGVYVEKFRAAKKLERDQARRLEQEYPDGTGLKGTLLRFVNRSIERLIGF